MVVKPIIRKLSEFEGTFLPDFLILVNMDKEIWKDIDGYDGLYQVSNLGNVRSFKRGKLRIMAFSTNKYGYHKITLHDNKVKKHTTIHQLVAKAFIPNPENKPQVNHINGIRNDNRLENLEWCTAKENTNHSIEILNSRKIGEHHSCSILDTKTVLLIVDLDKKGFLIKEISNITGVKSSTINNVINGRSWSHITNIYNPKGRVYGDKSKRAILKNDDAIDIVKLRRDGTSVKDIAKTYRVSIGLIYSILEGRSWSKVTGIKYTPKKLAKPK